MKAHYIIFYFIVLIAFPLMGVSQIPKTLSYQGVLTDSSGTPRPDADYNFTFSLYDSGSGGTLLWDETKTLPTKRGLFSTALGDATPFPAALKFDRSYWLNISVSVFGELSPRIQLASVGYSMNALWADTARYSIETKKSFTGKLLINEGQLEIRSESTPFVLKEINESGRGSLWRIPLDGRHLRFDVSNDGLNFDQYTTALDLKPSGDIWTEHKLCINGGQLYVYTESTPFVFKETDESGRGSLWRIPLDGKNLRFDASDDGVNFDPYTTPLALNPSGDVWIGKNLNVLSGRTTTSVLEITGGSDLAEPFPVSSENQLEEGSVVVIDESNPGHVMLSSEPYDNKVAGVVSGAGGIQPGLTLKQEGIMEGSQNIALTGRVYVKATASNGPIKPGDRLVTSSLPGHCMKATDSSQTDGAVIGKAMSSLTNGEGLVLLLINLQ